VTEEVWSWWQEGSVHRAPWPSVTELGSPAASDGTAIDAVAAALAGIRGAKSQAKVTMKTPLARVEVSGPEKLVRDAESASADLVAAGKIVGDLVFTVVAEATELSVSAEIAEQPAE
jgi:valyl-tRNA synthetase